MDGQLLISPSDLDRLLIIGARNMGLEGSRGINRKTNMEIGFLSKFSNFLNFDETRGLKDKVMQLMSNNSVIS